MKLFSSQSSANKGDVSTDIPQEIYQAVRVMGAAPFVAAPPQDLPVTVQPKKMTPKSASPFLTDGPVRPERNKDQKPAQNPELQPQTPHVSLAPEWNAPVTPDVKPLVSKEILEKSSGSKKGILLVAGAGLFLALGAGAYWYFVMRQPSPSPEPVVTEPVGEVMITTSPVVEEPPYSKENPNYLPLDVETVTVASFRTVIREASERIVAANMTAPVEFLLTDKNNNPLAFSRFAFLLNIELKPEVLSQLGETFSLSIYNDGGRARLGLALTMAPTAVSEKLIQVQRENSLPAAFQSLFYEDITVPKSVVFRSGMYKEYTVRYVNIDTEKNISFDYALRDKMWFIGTSKDTLRMILDK